MSLSLRSNKEIEIIARAILKDGFEVYDESHHLRADSSNRELILTYFDSFIEENRVCFILKIRGKQAHLDHIRIMDHLKGQGIGKSLYNSIHEISRNLGCEKISQVPRGGYRRPDGSLRTRKDYLLDMGYKEVSLGDVEIVL
jgi:GNAT superfamily N-acetyltransferase